MKLHEFKEIFDKVKFLKLPLPLLISYEIQSEYEIDLILISNLNGIISHIPENNIEIKSKINLLFNWSETYICYAFRESVKYLYNEIVNNLKFENNYGLDIKITNSTLSKVVKFAIKNIKNCTYTYCFEFKACDVLNQAAFVYFHQVISINYLGPGFVPNNVIESNFKKLMLDIFYYEINECFVYNGKRIFDPHIQG